MLSLLMKAEGNRSGYGPNRCSECSLICVPNACGHADDFQGDSSGDGWKGREITKQFLLVH